MQWLTLRRVTNYVEKHRLLSTDYKSSSNGQSEEKKKIEAKQDIRRGKEFFPCVDRSTLCQLLISRFLNYRNQQPCNCLSLAWIIIVVKVYVARYFKLIADIACLEQRQKRNVKIYANNYQFKIRNVINNFEQQC